MSDFKLQRLAQVYVSTDLPSHKEIVNDAINEIEQLRARVAELELQIRHLMHYEETAARELLFWWAERLSNAPNEDMRDVVRDGYQRIVNLANVIDRPGVKAEKAGGTT